MPAAQLAACPRRRDRQVRDDTDRAWSALAGALVRRRALGEADPFNPVRRLGEVEIDILHRRVRAGSSELHLTGLEQSLPP